MWKLLANARLKRFQNRSRPVSREEIQTSRCVLFAVFARYGDSIIAFKSINRFVSLYPDKRYLLITTYQALPYARELIKSSIEMQAINKRHNPLKLIWLMLKLRHMSPDVGFNPWSHGRESELFVSYCRRFHFFRGFDESCGPLNHYEKLRVYMSLPIPSEPRVARSGGAVRQILLSPFSTDPRRSLSREQFETLVRELRMLHSAAKLKVAVMKDELALVNKKQVDGIFVFGKSCARSLEFLALMKSTDLFVGVDSGPLHLADALNVPAIAIFGPTTPEIVLDHGSRAVARRMTTPPTFARNDAGRAGSSV